MLKKIKIVDFFIVLLFSILFHFIYSWIPNTITSIFFPVNESIWEHMKLIISSFYIVGILDYILINKNKIKVNNFFIQLFIIPIIGVFLYLLIYLPIYNMIGENMVFSIILLIIIIIIEEVLSYYLLNISRIEYQKPIGFLGILVVYVFLGYLTYNPFYNYVFYDHQDNKYGINIYRK